MLGYPGLDNPILAINQCSTGIATRQARRGTQVHYSLPGAAEMTLPDRYNGLGFKEPHLRWSWSFWRCMRDGLR